MAKILPIFSAENVKLGYVFNCPQCGFAHKFCTTDAHTEGWPIWTLTGTEDAPTIRDSILIQWPENGVEKVCHSWVTDGMIFYPDDCAQPLAGQTVPLPDM